MGAEENRLPSLRDTRIRSAVDTARLDPLGFKEAQSFFRREDYGQALTKVQECLDCADEAAAGHLTLLPRDGDPTVTDGVVLWAQCLYQLDRFTDFEVLLASAGKWGLVPEQCPELDVVQLFFAFKRGQYLEVVEEATSYIDLNRFNLPPAIADYLYLRGLANSSLGDPDRAREDTETAYSLFRVLGEKNKSARAANALGMLLCRESDYAQADKWFRRALDLHQNLGLRKNMGGNHLNLGITAYKRGDFPAALVELQAARRHLADVDAKVSLCRLAIARGQVLRLQRKFDLARRELTTGYEMANDLLLSREEALALEFLGDVTRDEGHPEQARRFYSRALAIGRSIAPDGDIVMEVLRRQGQSLSRLGRHTEAVTVLSRAQALARRQGDRFEEACIRRAQAETLFEMGDLVSARHHGRQAMVLLEEIGAGFELAKARLAAARVSLACLDSGQPDSDAGNLDQAWQLSMGALDLFLKSGVEHWVIQARQFITLVSDRRQEQEQDTAVASSAPAEGQFGSGPETPIIHVSARMRDLIQLTDAFADSGEPVLITGATGTGKEVFARRLHAKSGRRRSNLVSVNVTAIPESMFAREFFGHVKGSFSGADRDGGGLAAKADGGTLFLDEIGELPLELQPRLLRLLQDGTYHAIGDPAERRTDIRLIAATNANLEDLVAQGRFRADLYYRLKILELKLPPLSQRREDILPLLKHFLSLAAQESCEPVDFFNRPSLELMQRYDWPGNVREIAMVARQARVQLMTCGEVNIEVNGPEGLPLVFTGPQQDSVLPGLPLDLEGDGDRSRIVLALAETAGNRAEAARRLGVSRSTLYRHMEKLGIAGKQEVR